MNFEKEIKEDILIQKINIKRATFRETDEFRELLQGDINNGWKKMIVDMENCEFMDSAFLGLLITISKQLEKNSGFLKLAAVHDDAMVILEITKTNQLFQVYTSVDEALKSSFSY